MLPWQRIPWKAEAVFLALLMGCASAPGVPLVEDTGQGKALVHIPRTLELHPILLEEGVTVTVDATAMTMGASGSGGTSPCIETHHIATICNDKSTARGGAWTPRFRDIFAKAGMSMDDPANKMPLPGHYGPHPERYHQIILDELLEATAACRSVVDCRAALTARLRKLARQLATPGTELASTRPRWEAPRCSGARGGRAR